MQTRVLKNRNNDKEQESTSPGEEGDRFRKMKKIKQARCLLYLLTQT